RVEWSEQKSFVPPFQGQMQSQAQLRLQLVGVLRPHTHTHTHTPTVLSRSSIISLRARTRCTSKTHSLWRALYHATLIPGLRPGGLSLGYKHSGAVQKVQMIPIKQRPLTKR